MGYECNKVIVIVIDDNIVVTAFLCVCVRVCVRWCIYPNEVNGRSTHPRSEVQKITEVPFTYTSVDLPRKLRTVLKRSCKQNMCVCVVTERKKTTLTYKTNNIKRDVAITKLLFCTCVDLYHVQKHCII